MIRRSKVFRETLAFASGVLYSIYMSTIASDQSSTFALHAKALRAGRRTYFFDIKRAERGELYVAITESKGVDGQFERHKLLLPAIYSDAFFDALKETVQELGRMLGDRPPEPEAERITAPVPVSAPEPKRKRR